MILKICLFMFNKESYVSVCNIIPNNSTRSIFVDGRYCFET